MIVTRSARFTAPTIAILAFALTACGSSAEEPIGLKTSAPAPSTSTGPEPSPTPTPEPTLEEQHVEAAKALFQEYMAALNTANQNGHLDPAPVLDLLWGDMDYRKVVLDEFRDMVQRGITQIGEMTIAELTVVEYRGDPPGGEQVILDACIDKSVYDLVTPDGTSIIQGKVDLGPATVTVQHQHDGRWTVVNVKWRRGEAC